MTERKISQFLEGSLGRFSSQDGGIPVYLRMVFIPDRVAICWQMPSSRRKHHLKLMGTYYISFYSLSAALSSCCRFRDPPLLINYYTSRVISNDKTHAPVSRPLFLPVLASSKNWFKPNTSPVSFSNCTGPSLIS